MRYTPNQWKSVLQMFQTMSTKSGVTENESSKCSSWILETGASFHMTRNRKLLRDLVPISPVIIKLPDNRVATAYEEISLEFLPLTRINHVLFIPCIDFNLTSFAQLTSDMHCIVMLIDKLCVI